LNRYDGLANNRKWRLLSTNSGAGTAGYLTFDLLNDAGSAVTTSVMTLLNSGDIGIGSTSPMVSLDLSQKTDALALPVGNTGQRPPGMNGELRYNTSTSTLEAFIGGLWTSLNGAGSPIESSGRLTGSGTTLSYCPYKGNLKTTAAQGVYTIPSGCLTATTTSLSANTLYYVYLWYNGSGAWVLDAETTGHATDSATGIEVMSGNNTRTLVGMIHTDGSKNVNTSAVTPGDTHTVATWDNRHPTTTKCAFTTLRQINSTSLVLINGENSCSFVSWGDAAQFSSQQITYAPAGYQTLVETVLTIDGTSTWVTYLEGLSYSAPPGPAGWIMAISPNAYTPTEGYHYTEMLGMGGP